MEDDDGGDDRKRSASYNRLRSPSPEASSEEPGDEEREAQGEEEDEVGELRIENQRLREQLQSSRGGSGRGRGGCELSAFVDEARARRSRASIARAGAARASTMDLDDARAHRSRASTWAGRGGQLSERFCAQCDSPLSEDAAFCLRCGARAEHNLMRLRTRKTRSRSASPESGHDEHRLRELEEQVEHLMEENEHLTEQLNETTTVLQDMRSLVRTGGQDAGSVAGPEQEPSKPGLTLWREKVHELMSQHYEAQEKAKQEHLVSLNDLKLQYSEIKGKYSKCKEECAKLHEHLTRMNSECQKKGAQVSELTSQCNELKDMLDEHMQSNREVTQQLEMELEAERLLRSSPSMKGAASDFGDFSSTAPAGLLGPSRSIAPSGCFSSPRAKELLAAPRLRRLELGGHNDSDSEPESTVKPQRIDGGTTLDLQSVLLAEVDASNHSSPRSEPENGSPENSARLSARPDRERIPSRGQVQPLSILQPVVSEWSPQVVKMKELLSLAQSQLKEATVTMQPLIKYCEAN